MTVSNSVLWSTCVRPKAIRIGVSVPRSTPCTSSRDSSVSSCVIAVTPRWNDLTSLSGVTYTTSQEGTSGAPVSDRRAVCISGLCSKSIVSPVGGRV